MLDLLLGPGSIGGNQPNKVTSLRELTLAGEWGYFAELGSAVYKRNPQITVA